MQGTIIPADGTGAQYETNVGNATQTLATNNSGASAPGVTYDDMFWADTSLKLLKMRDTTNASWIVEGELEQPFLGLPMELHRNTLCAHENLRVAYATSTTFTVTADFLLLRDVNTAIAGAANRYYSRVAASVNLTLSSATSGALGLDTGVIAAGWYGVWVLMKADGTQTAVFSLARPGSGTVTLPAGYKYQGFVSSMYWTGSAWLQVVQIGDVAMRAQVTAVNATAAAAYTSIPLTTYVPPNAKTVRGFAQLATSNGANTLCQLWLAADSAGIYVHEMDHTCAASLYHSEGYELPLFTAQTLWYKSAGTGHLPNVYINGWRY